MKAPSNCLLLCLTILVCLPAAANGQVLSGLQIGKASDNSLTKGKPAQFVATFPETGEEGAGDSYLIDGFIGLNIFESTTFTLSGIAEWHKNTMLEAEQDVRQFGLNAEKIFRFFRVEGNPFMEDYRWHLYTTFDLKTDYNAITERKGAVASLSVSNNFPLAWENFSLLQPDAYHPNSTSPISNLIQVRHSHSIGLDYLGSHSLLMSNLSFGIELYPFSGLIKKIGFIDKYNILLIKSSVAYRGALSDPDPDIDRGALWTYGIDFNYTFGEDEKQSLQLGYQVSDGADPMKGLANQKFSQLSLKLKLNLD